MLNNSLFVPFTLTSAMFVSCLLFAQKERAKSLASDVMGEARPFEDILNFQPEKGAILANATPLGMHPNTDRVPVSEVLSPIIITRTSVLFYAASVTLLISLPFL